MREKEKKWFDCLRKIDKEYIADRNSLRSKKILSISNIYINIFIEYAYISKVKGVSKDV